MKRIPVLRLPVFRMLMLAAVFGLLAAACGSGDPDTKAVAGGDSESLTSEDVDESAADESNETADADPDADDSDADDADDADEGGSDNITGSPGDTLSESELNELLAATSEMTSGRFEATMEITGGPTSEMPGTFVVAFSGAFDQANAASEISMDMSDIMSAAMAADPEIADDPSADAMMAMMAPFFEEPMQVITIGDKAWVKWGLFAMFGLGDKWLETDADGSMDMTSDLGVDAGTPGDMMGDLADTGQTFTYVGEEDVRGTIAAHYRSELDTESLTDEQRAAFGDDLPEDGTYVMHIWIADDLVQRFQIDISDLEQTAENEFESMTMVYDILDHGADVDISPPPASEVVSEDELDFDLGEFSGGS